MLKRQHTSCADGREESLDYEDCTAARTAAKRRRVERTPSSSTAERNDSFRTNTRSPSKLNVLTGCPSPLSETSPRDRKRRRERSTSDCKDSTDGFQNKRRRREDTKKDTVPHAHELGEEDWVIDKEQRWTEHVRQYTMAGGEQRRGSVKRSASQSYRQSISNGDSPYSWTAKHQEEMAHAGVLLDELPNMTMALDDKEMCDTILGSEQGCPDEWLYQRSAAMQVVAAAAPRNEARVVRDIGPYFFPSPEVEHTRGHAGLKDIAEGLGAPWGKCAVWCGPTPKPDGTHAISRWAFSLQEQNKLKWNNTSACETGLYPFYVCEAKSSDRSLEEAKRQASHSASVAARTVIELYEPISAVHELDRRVLTFSIAHNHRTAEISAHYPIIDGAKYTFCRKVLRVVDIKDDTDWQAGYRTAFGIWRHFFPTHLARVRDALSRQQDRGMASFAAQLGLEDDAVSTAASTPSSSQEDGRAKRPSSSLTIKMQEENARLREKIDTLMDRLEQQFEQQRRESQDSRQREAELAKRSERQEEKREALELQLLEQQKQSATLQERVIELLSRK